MNVNDVKNSGDVTATKIAPTAPTKKIAHQPRQDRHVDTENSIAEIFASLWPTTATENATVTTDRTKLDAVRRQFSYLSYPNEKNNSN